MFRQETFYIQNMCKHKINRILHYIYDPGPWICPERWYRHKPVGRGLIPLEGLAIPGPRLKIESDVAYIICLNKSS